VCLSLAVIVALLGRAPAGASASASWEYTVKAAFLYQFLRFSTDSVAAVRAPDPADCRICIVGSDPFGPALDDAVRGKTARGKPISVRRFAGVSDLEPCALIFVAAGEMAYLPRIIQRLHGTGSLTVGDSRDFARLGGMVGFFVEGARVRFAVDERTARGEDVIFSSQLLAVAAGHSAAPGGRR
jgi:hypothetical protein